MRRSIQILEQYGEMLLSLNQLKTFEMDDPIAMSLPQQNVFLKKAEAG
jgi:hypothetical protein